MGTFFREGRKALLQYAQARTQVNYIGGKDSLYSLQFIKPLDSEQCKEEVGTKLGHFSGKNSCAVGAPPRMKVVEPDS